MGQASHSNDDDVVYGKRHAERMRADSSLPHGGGSMLAALSKTNISNSMSNSTGTVSTSAAVSTATYLICAAGAGYGILIMAVFVHEARKHSRHAEGGEEDSDALNVAWNYFDTNPQFFKTLDIAEDGGFSEVPQLFTGGRWFWALILLVVIGLNVGMLVVPNFRTLVHEPWTEDTIKGVPLIFNSVLFHAGSKEMRSKVLLAFVELLIMFFFIARTLKCLCTILFHVWKGDGGSMQRKWNSVADLLFDILPSLSATSGLRMLGYVAPSVFAPAATQCIAESKATGKWHELAFFMISRLLAAAIGMDAFMVKFLSAADATRRTSGTGLFWEIFVTLSFLNQMLGVVNVGMFSRQRVLLFIFGGEDGQMTADELAKLDTWHAMMARKIWEASRKLTLATPWFFAVALSYSDYDFQKLTLNGQGAANFLAEAEEDAEGKSAGAKGSEDSSEPVP